MFRHIEDGLDEKKPCPTPETIPDDVSSQRPITPATSSSVTLDPIAEQDLKKNHKKAITNALSFVLALVLHTSLEGFAFGKCFSRFNEN